MTSKNIDTLSEKQFIIRLIIGSGVIAPSMQFICKSSHDCLTLINKVKSEAHTIHPDFEWTKFCEKSSWISRSIWNALTSKGYIKKDVIIENMNNEIMITYFEYFSIFIFLAKRANVTITEIILDGSAVIGGAGLIPKL